MGGRGRRATAHLYADRVLVNRRKIERVGQLSGARQRRWRGGQLRWITAKRGQGGLPGARGSSQGKRRRRGGFLGRVLRPFTLLPPLYFLVPPTYFFVLLPPFTFLSPPSCPVTRSSYAHHPPSFPPLLYLLPPSTTLLPSPIYPSPLSRTLTLHPFRRPLIPPLSWLLPLECKLSKRPPARHPSAVC